MTDDDRVVPEPPGGEGDVRAAALRRRGDQIMDRLGQLHDRLDEIERQSLGGRGSTAEAAAEAQANADRSRGYSAEAHLRAAERHEKSAEVHERVASLFDELGHEDRAQAHRRDARLAREAAEAAYRAASEGP